MTEVPDRPGFEKSRHRERAQLLGYEMTAGVGPGSHARWTPSDFMSNSRGVVHGGLVGTIIDDVAAVAIFQSDPTIAGSATVSMHIDYLEALIIGAEYTCTGEAVRIGGRLAVADARIVDADGKLCIRGVATFAIHRSRQPPPSTG